MPVSVLDCNKQKLASAIALVDNLCEGDFPYEHSRVCLKRVRDTFVAALSALEVVDDSTDPLVVQELCAAQNNKLFDLFEYLGLFVRSTDVRNAFEFHGPFLRIVRAIIGVDSNLVISSEWDYSPFTILPPDECDLDDTVMIGIPASESDNALVLPLAGHELGHNVWAKNRLKSSFGPVAEDAVVDHIKTELWDKFSSTFNELTKPEDLLGMFGKSTWQPSWNWCMRQCQELFCDFVGLAIFREAFLKSFAFLIAPGLPGRRDELYPGTKDRAAYLQDAAREMGIDVPAGFIDSFANEDRPTDYEHSLLLDISDAATRTLVPTLIEKAKKQVSGSEIPKGSEAETHRIVAGFAKGVPSTGVESITSLLNAAWKCWDERDQILESEGRNASVDSTNYLRELSDLVFKSLEVYEIEQLTREYRE